MRLAHVCMTTPFDYFVYVLSVEKDERVHRTRGNIPYILSLHCHVTAFIWAFEQLAQCFLEGRTDRVSSRLKSLPGRPNAPFASSFRTILAA